MGCFALCNAPHTVSRRCPRGEMDITTAFEAVGGGSIPSEDTDSSLEFLHKNFRIF